MLNTLSELADKYATDKRDSDHGYVTFYDKHFNSLRHLSLNICEIGILNHPDKKNRPYEGASLLMWKDYFYKSGIHGIDINDHKHLEQDRIRIYIADQGNREKLQQLFKSALLDIIIEDGSHYMHHQQISLGCLFKNLKSGGIFVIEDLHTSHLDMVPNFRQTTTDTNTLEMLKDFNNTGKIVSNCMTQEEQDYLNDNISKCIIEEGRMSEIAFIYKK